MSHKIRRGRWQVRVDRRRIRVLLIAELANPEWISVPLVGWSHFQALSRVADVHLVTHRRNRENVLARGLREGSDFDSIDTGAVERPLGKIARLLGAGESGGWTTLTALSVLSYYEFERQLWRRYRDRLRAGEFDLVHRLTPLSPTMPSLVAAQCARLGVPFVIGPLNGGVPWPRGFDGARLREREFLTYVRGAHRLLPGYRSTRACAAAIVTASRDTRRQFEPAWRDRTVYIPENGIDPTRFDLQATGEVASPLRVVFVGRLSRYKCPDVLIEAAAPMVREGRMTVELLGDGPFMPALRDQVAREGVGAGVSLPGWVDHRVLKERLVRSHVFAFPSVREFGGAVVLEAMATGLVPVVVDYGGPGELVSERTGFRVPLGSRAQLVAGFRSALERLASEPGRIREVGERARERVLRWFTWEAKAAQMLEVYRWVLERRDRPDFGMPFPDEPEGDAALPGAARSSG
ncbi:MAG TPA: glycosyltransferase family 4 protein [Anaeromyxobacteraceae bacterium]|jgi:glycosyltransferase involved in cell wall biosynthesis|nr:glycosyltransferase family 4 protein [Anaeromyxobacteraceae bacterium]